MRRYTGPVVMAIGLLHILYVFATLRGPISSIARDGIFDAVDPYHDRNVAFWSLWFGVLLLTVGYLIHWTQSRVGTMPALPGWVLLGMGLTGGILMPASPFWVAIPLGLSVLLPARPARERSSPPAPIAASHRSHGNVPA